MKKSKFKILIYSGIIGALMCFPAFARTNYKRINSVKINVGTDLKKLEIDDIDDIPDISAGDFSVSSSAKYEVYDAEWHDSKSSIKVGSKPKVSVYLSAITKDKDNGDDIWYEFKGSYNSSNVRVSGGEFVSARKYGRTDGHYNELEVVLSLDPIRGDYEEPYDLYWSGRGTARWSEPEITGGCYEGTLYRDSYKIVTIRTDKNYIDFYPWMEREGEYTFHVKTIAYDREQRRYANDSDEEYSEEKFISDNNKSDGRGKYSTNLIGNTSNTGNTGSVPGGQQNNNNNNGNIQKAGWIKTGASWQFYYPNGNPIKTGWLSWNGSWYYFENSFMKEGWYKNPSGYWYYFVPGMGNAKTGWELINGNWYFFNTNKNAYEGTMLAKSFVKIKGKWYYFADNGAMVRGWVGVKDANAVEQFYYFYPETNVNHVQGEMAINTVIDGFKIDANGRWQH